jgi:hypothetical protein
MSNDAALKGESDGLGANQCWLLDKRRAAVEAFECFDRVQRANVGCAHPRIASHTRVYVLRSEANEPQPLASNTAAPIQSLLLAIESTDGAGSPGCRKISPTGLCPSHTAR